MSLNIQKNVAMPQNQMAFTGIRTRMIENGSFVAEHLNMLYQRDVALYGPAGAKEIAIRDYFGSSPLNILKTAAKQVLFDVYCNVSRSIERLYYNVKEKIIKNSVYVCQ